MTAPTNGWPAESCTVTLSVAAWAANALASAAPSVVADIHPRHLPMKFALVASIEARAAPPSSGGVFLVRRGNLCGLLQRQRIGTLLRLHLAFELDVEPQLVRRVGVLDRLL